MTGRGRKLTVGVYRRRRLYEQKPDIAKPARRCHTYGMGILSLSGKRPTSGEWLVVFLNSRRDVARTNYYPFYSP